MDIPQYAMPWSAVGIPILQIPLKNSAGIFAKSRVPFHTFSLFRAMISIKGGAERIIAEKANYLESP